MTAGCKSFCPPYFFFTDEWGFPYGRMSAIQNELEGYCDEKSDEQPDQSQSGPTSQRHSPCSVGREYGPQVDGGKGRSDDFYVGGMDYIPRQSRSGPDPERDTPIPAPPHIRPFVRFWH